MFAQQLELDWEQAISLALAEPEQANIKDICTALEVALVGRSLQEQLKVAGQALGDLAGVCQKRAELIWADWVDHHNTQGPIPDEQFLAGLVQETMFLDISALVKQPQSRQRRAQESDAVDSLVQEMDKTQLLALLAAVEEEGDPNPEEMLMALEHDEAVGVWVEVVRLWLATEGIERIEFLELLEGVELSRVQVWLAILLGGFEISQQRQFYELEGITVRLP